MGAIIAAHDGKVQMIDSSVVRVQQQAAAQKTGWTCLYRSKSWRSDDQAASAGDRHGLPVQIELSPGQMNDQPMAELLLNDLPVGADVIAGKGYDADWIRD
jgi:Transposase DDE domain